MGSCVLEKSPSVDVDVQVVRGINERCEALVSDHSATHATNTDFRAHRLFSSPIIVLLDEFVRINVYISQWMHTTETGRTSDHRYMHLLVNRNRMCSLSISRLLTARALSMAKETTPALV